MPMENLSHQPRLIKYHKWVAEYKAESKCAYL